MDSNYTPHWIFVHAQKCGGTAMRECLGNDFPRSHSAFSRENIKVHPSHAPAAVIRDFFGEDVFYNAFKFGFKRNPYDRIVSWYHYENPSIAYQMPHEERFRNWMRNRSGLTVEQQVLERPTVLWELWSDGQRILLDEVYDFYEIDKVWSEVCQHTIGVYRPLHKSNNARGRKKDWRVYYDTYSFELVTQLFQKDIDYFDYSFNPKEITC
jgi:hypothetical protein